MWCENCSAEVDGDDAMGFTCCSQCGRVLSENVYASDVQFAKGADGEGVATGMYIGESGQARGAARYSGGRMWSGQSGDGHEAAINRGRNEIAALVSNLKVTPAGEATEAAHRLYKLAMVKGFTRGRRIAQVAAACLYIFCRQDRRAYMLIDFSDQLSINIYTLGAVYLQLLRLFRLDNYAAFTKPIDPSLYLHRFVDKLKLGEKSKPVAATALKLVQSMKRDWLQTGRRPSGICGAALFIAAHAHGCECSKKDIIAVVHVGWSTLEKRVMEFAHSNVGELTIKDFEDLTDTYREEKERVIQHHMQLLEAAQTTGGATTKQPAAPTSTPEPPKEGTAAGANTGEGGAEGEEVDEEAAAEAAAEAARIQRLIEQEKTGACEHVDMGDPIFAYGMCRSCFEEYLDVSGGVYQSSVDPPAFTQGAMRALRKQVMALPAPTATPAASQGLDELANAAATQAAGTSKGDAGEEEADAEQLGRQMDELLPSLRSQAQRAQRAAMEAEAAAAAREAADRAAAERAGQPAGDKAADASNGAAEGKRVQFGLSGEEIDAIRGPETATTGAATATAGKAAGAAAAAAAATAMTATAVGATAAAAAAAAARAGGSGSGSQASAGTTTAAVPGGSGSGKGLGTTTDPPSDAIVLEEIDTLSDVEDEDVELYIASKEEAEVKTMLWTEMNKDWLDKQEAKKKVKEAEEKAGPRAKRAYVRRAKALPPADSAEGAAKNMLEAKKLSNKINYSVLEDLFRSDAGDRDQAAGSGEQQGEGEEGQQEEEEEEQEVEERVGGKGPGAGKGKRTREVPTADVDVGGGEEPAVVTAAMKKRAEARAREQAQDAKRYKLALQQEQSKRGAGGLGGGFLGSLTFASKDSSAAKARPQGLGSLRPRGK